MRRWRMTLRILSVLVAFIFFCGIKKDAAGIHAEEHTHKYQATIEKHATETADGIRKFTCVICGHSYTQRIPAQGHQWSGWMVVREPTCGRDGLRQRQCSRYGGTPHYDRQTIPRTNNHTYDSGRVTKEPDCIHTGTRTYTCTTCGNTKTESIKATGKHQYESTEKKATCTKKGRIEEVCKVCGDINNKTKKTMPVLGHAYGSWIVDKEPTTNHEGHRYRVCTHDKTHIIEETMEKLTTTPEPKKPSITDIDVGDAVIGGTTAVGGVALSVPLVMQLHVLLWYRRKKRSFLLEE